MSALNASIGEYRLVDFIGAGGMGEVYRAVHTRLGRVIAIKILTQLDEPFVQRFQNEVRIQASLRHPAIAEYYGVHEYEGRPCLLMELVDGQTLADRIRARGAFAPGEACAILRQVAEAVGYVHTQGIVHRDLKANNIKITSGGQVKLLDFGIARTASAKRLTRVGMLVGTLENLAPEQVSGGEGDARSDIWALGVLLYEMVTGRLPFESASLAELYAKILRAEYTAPAALNPAVPAALEHVIGGCLRKKSIQRFQSARELIEALDAVPVARPAASAGLSRRWLVAGGVAAAALVVALLALFSGRPDNNGGKKGTTSVVVTRPDSLKTITVNTFGGPAEVYKDGQRLGVTPYQIQAATGDKIELELRRNGYRDQPVSFDVTERAEYSYTMEPR